MPLVLRDRSAPTRRAYCPSGAPGATRISIPIYWLRRASPTTTRFMARTTGPATDVAESRHGLEPRSSTKLWDSRRFLWMRPRISSAGRQRARVIKKDRKRLFACPLNAARDRRGKVREMPRGLANSAKLWTMFGTRRYVARCRGCAMRYNGKGQPGRRRRRALVRPPWAFVSARDRTPRLGRTALHLVSLGAARAVAAAQRRLRRDCAAGGKSSGRNLQSKQFEAADDQDHARCARCLLQRAGAAVDAEDASARTP